jgi:hypothetical protein
LSWPWQQTLALDSTLWSLLRGAGRPLRLHGPLAEDSTARIVHTVLLCAAAWVICNVALGVFVLNRRPGAPVALSTILQILTVLAISGALVLLHMGSFRAAGAVYLCASWLLFTVVIILDGGIHSVAAVYYLAIPISAAWLLGYRAALGSAAVCLASSLIMAIREAYGFSMPRSFPGTPIGTWWYD